MAESQESQASPDHGSLEDLTPEEANRIIHSHRKVRYGTACWPCRQRKVKCDNKQPCENCVKRDHAQLCSYKPNRSSANKPASISSDTGTHARKRAHSPDAHDGETKNGVRQASWPRTIANVDDSEAPEVHRFVGQNSIPALLREQSSSNDRESDIRQDMRSILGLDTSAPFPLMSSRHLDRMTQDIATELPSDREVMKLFRSYKETPQPFWGFVIDIDDLESKLMVYLEDRARNAKSATKTTKPVSASWLAILFAVLAVGSQYHDSPYHTRTMDSQKYIQISFHFLRLGNFLLRPTFDAIQALLMTSFVLLNDMKAEASWALLGLTCRLAQSLGLHRPNPQDGRESAPPDSKSTEMVRRKLWWTCVWHDTLTSLSFDRPPVTNMPSCPIPITSSPELGNLSYLETMMHLIQIISRRLNPDVATTVSYQQVVDNCEAVEDLRRRVAPNIRYKEQCKSALDVMQFFAIRLHTSFVISVCCRPALRRDCTRLEPEQKRILADRCQANLTETVRMFLAMHQLSVIPTRSWAFTYHGLSSALLLGILTETKADPEVRQLQGDLIQALSATAVKEQASPVTHVPKTDKDIELSGPLWRALTALKNIYDHGSISVPGVKKELESASGSRARTPLPPTAGTAAGAIAAPTPAAPVFRGLQPGVDPHQDAALAMAEMQNGGAGLAEFPSSLPYTSPIPGGVGMENIAANMDPATYMSPLDLYESIWWESPDPWNNGMDAMNFDFIAQPPPGQGQQQFYF